MNQSKGKHNLYALQKPHKFPAVKDLCRKLASGVGPTERDRRMAEIIRAHEEFDRGRR